MDKVTVIIISKNDEDVLSEAILSCKDFGEVIVVDSSSTSDTQKICEKYHAKYIRHQFKDFSDQRNFAMSHVTTDWIFFLDSDERITKEFKEEAVARIKGFDSLGDIAGFYVYRKTFFYGKDWNFTDRVQRLFYRKKFIGWYGVVHETPRLNGELRQIDAPILHFTHRNLSQMIIKTNEWSEYEAKLRFENKHPILVPWRFFRVMATAFFDSYVKNKGYKNGTYGIIEGIYQSFSMFITYAKLWEMQQKMINS